MVRAADYMHLALDLLEEKLQLQGSSSFNVTGTVLPTEPQGLLWPGKVGYTAWAVRREGVKGWEVWNRPSWEGARTLDPGLCPLPQPQMC